MVSEYGEEAMSEKYLEYLDYDDEDSYFSINSRRPNAHGGLHCPKISTLQPLSNSHQKFYNRVRIEPLEEWEGSLKIGMSNKVTTSIRECIRDTAIGKTKTKDKADRATIEKVLDPRTELIIFKLMGNNGWELIHGCISTGKEANVYHTFSAEGQEFAIKIFKTSILDFKNRTRYIEGDYRFRHRYCNKNPRKMMVEWAEKEMRNLKRIEEAGIRCPTGRLCKGHILVMDFIGKNGLAAPRLNDADLSLNKLRECYREIIVIMRTLYQKAKLVHTDLSEYNILYFEGHMYVIDVSQAVEISQTNAIEFLRQDVLHVSNFFKKCGVAVMTVRELFDFIVDPSIVGEEAVDSYLDKVQEEIAGRDDTDISMADNDDSVFVQSYIPSTLHEVMNAEADVKRLTSGEDTEDMYYKTITGLRQALLPLTSEVDLSSDEEDTSSVASHTSSVNAADAAQVVPACDRKTARKENKKKVKEEKREARKHKLPKAAKKRRKKLSKCGK